MDRFRELGGHFVRGRGRVTGRGEVTVDTVGGTRVLRARRGIVVNTGTQPTIPPVPGLAGTPYWTNREAVETRPVTRPDSVRKLTRHVQCPWLARSDGPRQHAVRDGQRSRHSHSPMTPGACP